MRCLVEQMLYACVPKDSQNELFIVNTLSEERNGRSLA